MQIAILGRQTGLSLAELEALYGADNIQPLGIYAALVETDNTLPQAKLGATIKSGSVLAELKITELSGAFKWLKKYASQLAHDAPDGKLKIGLSAYGFDVKPALLNKNMLELKKTLKSAGRSVRVIENKSTSLSAAQILYNKLTAELGREFLLVKHSGGIVIAQTTGVQDIDDYSSRDFDRPKRDARVGMLPPKLAQTMINLTYRAVPAPATGDGENEVAFKSQCILDPFCGTGVVLQEAALMDFPVYGSDIEPRMIDYTRDNLVWLEDKYGLKADKFFEIADACQHTWRQPIGAVVCEGYLGQPFSAEPTLEKLTEVRHTTDTIMRKFLQNIAPQLKAGTPLVVGAPAWFVGRRIFHLKTLDDLKDLGYNQLSFAHASGEQMIYHREGQIVGREIIVLTRK